MKFATIKGQHQCPQCGTPIDEVELVDPTTVDLGPCGHSVSPEQLLTPLH